VLGGATALEPVLVVSQDEQHIVQICTGCGGKQRAALEPASVLLDVMQEFVCRHADCAPSRRATEVRLP
jgi:hypothetical protein